MFPDKNARFVFLRLGPSGSKVNRRRPGETCIEEERERLDKEIR